LTFFRKKDIIISKFLEFLLLMKPQRLSAFAAFFAGGGHPETLVYT
jgi:hypothetical protein